MARILAGCWGFSSGGRGIIRWFSYYIFQQIILTAACFHSSLHVFLVF